jgi:hypothetical protein
MNDRLADSEHERWANDAAAYALNALEESELRRFEEHLAECARCQDELAVMRRAVEALPVGVPALTPPPGVRQRVMATVRTEAAQQQAASAKIASGPRSRPRFPGLIVARPSIALAAAALVAVLVVVGALTLGGGSSGRTYAGVVYAPGASASLRQSGNTARLTFSDLPAPPRGRIYQVWLQRPRRALQPTRALFANRSGSITLPVGVRGVQAVLVTAEPLPSGSLRPTRAPVVVVRLA